MAFKRVATGNFRYVKYKECEEGQVLATGVYLGHKPGMYGIQHQIKEDDGSIAVLNSSGQLNWQFENLVTPGAYVRVTYNGMITIEKGKMKGKESHQFLLDIDEERSAEGSVAPVGNSSEAEEEEEDEEEEAAAAEEEAEEEAEETRYKPAPTGLKRAAAPEAAPAKKASSSEDVLNKYRRKKA